MKQFAIFTVLIAYAAISLAQNWTNYNKKNSGLIENNILAVTTDKWDNLWVGSTQGLNKFANGQWTDYAEFNEKLKDQFVNCLVSDGNTLWIGTDDFGVIEFNGHRWFEHAEATHRLNMKYIRDIAIDHAGVKWIGVTLSGFVEFDGVNWNKYSAADCDLLSDFILCVVIDSRDRKWVGTNDGLCVFDGRKWTSYTTKNSKLPNNICTAIAIDRNNVKWIGTLEGLCRFDGESWKIYNIDNCPIPGNQVNDLAFDSEGHLWMATDGGVAVFDCGERWDTFRAGDYLPKCMFQNITIDRRGNIWVGTDERGLYCLSGYDMDKALAARTPATSSEVAENLPDDNPAKGKGKGTKTDKPGKTDKPAADEAVAADERIRLLPNLEEGTLAISMSAPEAEVTFINAKGEKVRTVPKYRAGSNINISKMKKGTYTVKVKSAAGSRSVKFVLK
ncbi:MAG: T9SS type A sorting domain-containing protein [Bacteroidales bacterium]|nr:T9SS type A sorting domain-containing protein [Bacteroidales bacterium]